MQGMRRYRFRVFALQPIQSGITNTIDKLSNSNNLNGSTYVVAGEILTESFDVVFTPFGGPPSLSLPLEQTSTVQSNKEHTSTTHQEESMKRLPTELEMNLDTEIDAFLSDSTYQRSLDTYFRLDLSIDDQNDFKENSAHASHTCTSTSSIRNLNQFLRKSYGDIRLDTMDGQTIHSDMFSSYDASVLPILPAHDSIPLLPTRVLNTHPAISAQRLYRINQTTHDRINIDNDDHNMQQELASGATALPSTLTDSSLFIPLLTESTLLDLSLSVVRLPVRRVPPSAVDPWAPFIDSRLYKHCRKRQLSSVGCCPCMHSTL